MKNKGDGFLPDWFKRYVCPFCGKKGYYDDARAVELLLPNFRCMYCKERGASLKEE